MKGWIKDHRQELNSDIWSMPPIYHRVWQYIKYMANHEDNTIPMRDGSKLLIKKGQHLTSVRTIAQKVGWYERGIYKEPNPKTIQSVLDWLILGNMIYTDKSNRQYTLITVVNWAFYQGGDEVKVTESNSVEVTERQQSADINKNEKNEKKVKELMPSIDYELEFESFWNLYKKKTDKKNAFAKFKVARKKHSLETILDGTSRYMQDCEMKNTARNYIKGPAVFLNGENFNDEFDLQPMIQERKGRNDFDAYRRGLENGQAGNIINAAINSNLLS